MNLRRNAPIARLVSTGRFCPPRVMTNAELETLVDTSDEWIRTRTGIRERRIADPETGAADMGAAAARVAMERARVGVEDVDLILVSTATPDRLLPSTACDVQA
nr:3-oxoacyl-ACP synthase [Gemmatimonadota bacterium]